uniref:Mannose-P-dolichol utilization defect 1 protein isogeny n=1 Tax=Cajanus cajan TaxID=3821 RepID=A0A151S0R0_CAJCA|nr:Mannose-P-dolichol utilization defect 1 protein isogeny [Cajanus cajan]
MEYLGIDLSCAVGSLRNGNFPDKDCLLPLISKLLGYAIVAASTTVKLPQAPSHLIFPFVFAFALIFQILKILKHQSVRGLSMISFELEVVGYTIALAYCLSKGLPFSAYGELLFLLIQGALTDFAYFLFSVFPPPGTDV